MINKKILAALAAKINVILCVGEPKEVRQMGPSAAKKFVREQLKKDLIGTSNIKHQTSKIIIAYEPIWAVGTGASDSPEDSAEMARFIKSKVSFTGGSAPGGKSQKLKILYGGSITSKNAKTFLKQKDIDGALVGGASLNAIEFAKIAEIAGDL